MKYLSVAEMALKWGISERSARNYCAEDRVSGAVLIGKTWAIPEDAPKPDRKRKGSSKSRSLSDVLEYELRRGIPGGAYYLLAIELSFNSLSMSGMELTFEDVRFIFETLTVSPSGTMKLDDLLILVNHYELFDHMIIKAESQITLSFLKNMHKTLFRATRGKKYTNMPTGELRRDFNEEIHSVKCEDIEQAVSFAIEKYESKSEYGVSDILDLVYEIERIMPFSEGNGIISRLISFKECIRRGIVPFIIDGEVSEFYEKGLKKYEKNPGLLLSAVELSQERTVNMLRPLGIMLGEGESNDGIDE